MRSSGLTIGKQALTWGTRTYVMGILNITPDSFSGDGLLAEIDERQSGWGEERLVSSAMEQARRFVSTGVDFLDVGGESTRPGSAQISVEEEMGRVLPVIHALSREFDVLISVDTYKSEVAQAALEGGAQLVNDVWGLRADPRLAETVARYEVPIILMHNRSSWVHAEIKERLGGRYVGIPYENLIEDIKRELLESVTLARATGIPEDKIILDPGIGFGKTVEQNLELLNHLDEICRLGYPVMVGPSRKSFIGYTLDLPPDQRLEGTAAAVVVSILRGADIVRVHDVEFMTRLVRMTDAIVRLKH
ncbi:MAG TPA: dihydropteroate synthase [Anaerolineales bacterium]|nr:dihydropteroate synthase [Anaerolineales bacterium]